MKNVSELKGYTNFHHQGRTIFESFLSSLLNCNVNIQIHSISDFENRMGIDITSNVMRNCYDWEDREDEVIIVPKVMDYQTREVFAVLPIRLSGPEIHRLPRKYLDRVTRAISIQLTQCAEQKFKSCTTAFGTEFEQFVVSYCLTANSKEASHLEHLISIISKLSRTTFEANDFSTAFIYTRSAHEYSRNQRNGKVLWLSAVYDFLRTANIDKRFWYLCDGNTTAYLIDHHLKIKSMYVFGNKQGNFLDSYSLRNTLLGADILFRVTGSNQVSIIDSTGIEFCYIENKWRIRNYNSIAKIIEDYSGIAHTAVDSLIANIIYCAQNNVSSIIWVPQNSTEIDDVLVNRYSAFNCSIPITEPENMNLVRRIISSDGVTIIDREGQIFIHGAIVNLNKVESGGQVGTGESAAKLLSQNGVAVKISQDGNIKVFYSNGKKKMVF